MPSTKHLQSNPWPNTKWGAEDRPAIIVDGTLYSLSDLESGTVVCGDSAYVVGSTENNIGLICSGLEVGLIQFYDMHIADLSVLSHFKKLTHLAIRWNTKITSIEPLANHTNLRSLVLENTPKITSLKPLGRLKKLTYLDYSGGICNKNTANSLKPLSALQSLEKLILTNLNVIDGSLKPIADCKKLKVIELCNKFKTEEFAYLTAKMQGVDCEMFQAYVNINPINDLNVMVVGSRKPFLNSVKDKVKIQKYEEAFAKLVKKYSTG